MDLTVEKLSEILSQADPMQLVSRGAPSDEYYSEAEQLFPLLQARNLDVADIERLAQQVFSDSFAPLRIRRDICGPAAQLIWDYLATPTRQ